MLSNKFPQWFEANEEQQRPKRIYSRSFKLRLIEEVRKRPYLWDPSDEQYGNQTMNRKSWSDICNVMNTAFQNDDPMHPQLARKNFKNLRDMFKTRWLEFKMGKASAQKWDYFGPLNFLAEVFEKNDDGLDVTGFLNDHILNETEDDGNHPSNDEINLASLLFRKDEDKDDVTILDYSNDGHEFEALKRITEQFNAHPTSSSAADPPPKRPRMDNRAEGSEKATTPRQGITLSKKSNDNYHHLRNEVEASSSSTAPPIPALPPVISFIFDKYQEFQKKSPSMADTFENELLRVVISFNSRPTSS